MAPGFVTANCPPAAKGQPPAATCPIGFSSGAALYQTLMTGYNPQKFVDGLSCGAGSGTTCIDAPRVIESSWYGQPQQFQLLRNIRLGLTFTF